MLAVEVSFLTGRYVATAFDDRRASEWPPHPARLFSALAATCLTADPVVDAEYEALAWLEGLPAPAIAASPASEREVVTVFVPVNDAHQTGDLEAEAEAVEAARALLGEALAPKARTSALKKLEKAEARLSEGMARAVAAPAGASAKVAHAATRVLPESRGRQPRTFPSVTPEHPVVTFVWQAEPTEAQRRRLDGLLARLVRLGHSSSLVSARLVDEAPEPTWLPAEDGPVVLRTTRAGQLEALQAAFARHAETEPRVMPAAFTPYTDEPALARPGLPRACFETEALVLQRVRGPRLPLAAVPNLARTVRRLLLSTAPEPIPEALCGHRPDGTPSSRDHLAVVPLPFVGSEHATGQILGVALVLPRDAGPEDRRALYAAVDAWERAHRGPDDDADNPVVPIHLGALGSWMVRRLEDEPRPATLDMRAWTRPSRVWYSATPVALDRNPGDLGARDGARRADATARAESILEAAVERLGLPRPRRVTLAPGPLLAGSAPARAFGRFPADPDKHPRVLTHARIEFAEPVRGPLLIGAGRYLGMGLFRPAQKGESLG